MLFKRVPQVINAEQLRTDFVAEIYNQSGEFVSYSGEAGDYLIRDPEDNHIMGIMDEHSFEELYTAVKATDDQITELPEQMVDSCQKREDSEFMKLLNEYSKQKNQPPWPPWQPVNPPIWQPVNPPIWQPVNPPIWPQYPGRPTPIWVDPHITYCAIPTVYGDTSHTF